MTKIKRKNSIIITFSAPPQVFEEMKKFAAQKLITLSELLRRSFELFKFQDDQARYGRYGGIKIGQAKLTRLQREEQRTETIKMLQDAAPMKVIDYLVEIGYLDPDRVENNSLFCYRIKDEAAGRMLYQLQINQDNKEETYSRMVFNFNELIAALIKDKKI